jgi:preprotein translocase subunit YajC
VSNSLATFLPLVLIVLVFWFLVIRPTRRRQQQVSSVQSSLGPGSKVMLSSGIFGTVVSVADESVRLEIAPGTTIKVARQAVVRVVEDTTPDLPTDGPDDGPHDGPDESDGGPAPASGPTGTTGGQ